VTSDGFSIEKVGTITLRHHGFDRLGRMPGTVEYVAGGQGHGLPLTIARLEDDAQTPAQVVLEACEAAGGVGLSRRKVLGHIKGRGLKDDGRLRPVWESLIETGKLLEDGSSGGHPTYRLAAGVSPLTIG